jgi:hypothetical protein
MNSVIKQTNQLEKTVMAQSHQPESAFLAEVEYLKSELTSEIKREYIDGQIYAMAGAGFNSLTGKPLV